MLLWFPFPSSKSWLVTCNFHGLCKKYLMERKPPWTCDKALIQPWLVCLAGWVSPLKGKVRFPVRAQAWAVGSPPGWGGHEKQPIDVSLSHPCFPLSSPFLWKNQNHKINQPFDTFCLCLRRPSYWEVELGMPRPSCVTPVVIAHFLNVCMCGGFSFVVLNYSGSSWDCDVTMRMSGILVF